MLKHKQYLQFLEMVSSAKRIQDIWDVLRNSIDYESTQALGIQYVTVQRVIHQILWDIVGVFRYCGIQVLWDSDIVGDLTCGFPRMLSPANAMKAPTPPPDFHCLHILILILEYFIGRE